ncbi:MAG: hypothetical protein C0402_08430 [Thermodesulfovibrio sp.]|nr:hypothetical protein [Thermodesulfovibrio sp.]
MKKIYLIIFLCFITVKAHAGDITVSVTEVRDSRTTGQFFAGLDIKLRVMGDSLADAKGLKFSVTKATDDTGRDLLKKEDSGRKEFTKPDENRTGQAEIEVKLKNPSRKAAVVRELAGEVSIFSPSRDPNSVASLSSFMTHSGKKINNKALTAARVNLTIMTKKEFDEFKEQQKKEVKAKEGEMVKEFGEAMAKALGSLFGGMMEISENSVILNIADPDSKVIDLEFSDAAGAAMRSGSSMKTGDIRVFEFEKPMPQDAKLTIFLMTPKSMTRTSFKLSNIALP